MSNKNCRSLFFWGADNCISLSGKIFFLCDMWHIPSCFIRTRVLLSVNQLSVCQICKIKHITIEEHKKNMVMERLENFFDSVWNASLLSFLEFFDCNLFQFVGLPYGKLVYRQKYTCSYRKSQGSHISQKLFPLIDKQSSDLKKRSDQQILFDMTTIFVELRKYEFPYLLTLKMSFNQNQQKNISEPNFTDNVFLDKEPELDSIPLQRCTSREPTSSELEPKHLLI